MRRALGWSLAAATVLVLLGSAVILWDPLRDWWRDRKLYTAYALLEVDDPALRWEVCSAAQGRIYPHILMRGATAVETRISGERHVRVRTAGLSVDDLRHALDPGKRGPEPGLTVRFEARPGDASEVLWMRGGAQIALALEVIVQSDDVGQAALDEDSSGAAAIALRFLEDGAARLERATRAGQGRRLAFVVAGEVIAAPTVMTPVREEVQIVGGTRGFTQREARGYLAAMRARPYPCEVKVLDVGPIR